MSEAGYGMLLSERDDRSRARPNTAGLRSRLVAPIARADDVAGSPLWRGLVWSVSLGLGFWATVAVTVALTLR